MDRDVALLFVTRAIRMFGYGLLAVVLVLYLDALGLSAAEVGLLLALTLLGDAAVSLWLNAGVPPTQVAEWAGHSVNVLLRVYAKCVYGQDEVARIRIEAALALATAAGEPQVAITSSRIPHERP